MEPAELRLSPLQLNRYFIKKLAYAVKDSFEGQYDPTASFTYPKLLATVNRVQSESQSRDWRFELTVESDDASSVEFPYSLEIVLVGEFTVAEGYPDERAELLARVNGPSLLYSAAREALVTITSRSGFPAIVLPSVLFLPTERTSSNTDTASHPQISKPLGRKMLKASAIKARSGKKRKVTKKAR